MGEYIQTEERSHVPAIRLNRPEARNAFTRQMADEMEAIIDGYDADRNLRAAVIVAEGPTFSAGQDLIALSRGEMAITSRRGGFGIMAKPPEKPLIAAVEGQALAGGMELTLCCDLIVASSTAQFGLAEAKRGLVAVGGGCFRLPKRLPHNIAMEMVITAQPKSASEMERFGFVNRVVAPGTAVDAALELAELIVRNAPLAVKASKAIISSSIRENWSDTDGWEKQMEIFAPVHASNDFIEGLRAFAEKRDPVWLGK